MAETISGKKIKDLTEATALNDTDDMIVENATPKTQKVKWSTIYNAIKAKLANWTFTMNTTAKTIPGAVNELKTAVDKQNSDLDKLGVMFQKNRSTESIVAQSGVDNTLYSFTASAGSVYLLSLTVGFSAHASGNRKLSITADSGIFPAQLETPSNASGYTTQTVTTFITAGTATKINFSCSQNSGVALNLPIVLIKTMQIK